LDCFFTRSKSFRNQQPKPSWRIPKYGRATRASWIRRVRDSQYAATDYRKMLKANSIVASTSRKGNCWDNAPMESWFHTLKTEFVHHTKYATRAAAKRDLFISIEGQCNPMRRHLILDFVSPVQPERLSR
jgi:transposase InsO family protein